MRINVVPKTALAALPFCSVASPTTTWTQASGNFDFTGPPAFNSFYINQFDNFNSIPGTITVKVVDNTCWDITNVSVTTEQGGIQCYPDTFRGWTDNGGVMALTGSGGYSTSGNNWTTLAGMGVLNSSLFHCKFRVSVQSVPTPLHWRGDLLNDLYWHSTQTPAASVFPPLIDISNFQITADQGGYYNSSYATEHGFPITISGVPYACIVDQSDGFNVFNSPGGHYIILFNRPTSNLDGLNATTSVWGVQNVKHDLYAIVQYFMQSNPLDDNGQPVVNGHTGVVVTSPLMPSTAFLTAINSGLEIDYLGGTSDHMTWNWFRVDIQGEPDGP